MKRRKAREYALQLLFQLDIKKEKPTLTLFKRFWTDENGLPPHGRSNLKIHREAHLSEIQTFKKE